MNKRPDTENQKVVPETSPVIDARYISPDMPFSPVVQDAVQEHHGKKRKRGNRRGKRNTITDSVFAPSLGRLESIDETMPIDPEIEPHLPPKKQRMSA